MRQSNYSRVEDGKIYGLGADGIKYRMMKEAIKGYYDNHLVPASNMPSIQEINYSMGIFPDMGTQHSAKRMWQGLVEFLDDVQHNNRIECNSYFAIFDEIVIESEEHFQWLLWTQLEYAPKNIIQLPQGEDAKYVSSESDFCIIVGGNPITVLCLHPQHSNQARRFPWPVLIFRLT